MNELVKVKRIVMDDKSNWSFRFGVVFSRFSLNRKLFCSWFVVVVFLMIASFLKVAAHPILNLKFFEKMKIIHFRKKTAPFVRNTAIFFGQYWDGMKTVQNILFCRNKFNDDNVSGWKSITNRYKCAHRHSVENTIAFDTNSSQRMNFLN